MEMEREREGGGSQAHFLATELTLLRVELPSFRQMTVTMIKSDSYKM
jgi:hypothetical protein